MMYDHRHQKPTTGTHGYSRLPIIIQNNMNIPANSCKESIDFWKHGLVALKAAATELLVAGLAQWVCFVCDRWQEIIN
jgi:hypothetical protein